MSPSPQPFAFQGSFQLAADPSLPVDGIPFNVNGQFVASAEGVANLSGTGTYAGPFGSVAGVGAKGLLIRYDTQPGAANVLVTINGGSQALEISPGGFIVWFNPAPAAGALSVSIAYTASCQLRLWVLG